MSIKKEINALINLDNGIYSLNEISYLTRYTKDALGEDVDKLRLVFTYIVGIKGGAQYEIKARTYEEILDEIEKYTREYFAECANIAVKNLRNGYR